MAIVVVIVVVLSGGGEGGGSPGKNAGDANATPAPQKSGKRDGNGAGHKKQAGAHSAKSQAVKLEVEPTAEVWTCVIDNKGKPLVDGLTLGAGETVGPFHARSYTAAFGNGSVHVMVDGKAVDTPSTPSPMGISVDAKGKVHELAEGNRPSCE